MISRTTCSSLCINFPLPRAIFFRPIYLSICPYLCSSIYLFLVLCLRPLRRHCPVRLFFQPIYLFLCLCLYLFPFLYLCPLRRHTLSCLLLSCLSLPSLPFPSFFSLPPC